MRNLVLVLFILILCSCIKNNKHPAVHDSKEKLIQPVIKTAGIPTIVKIDSCPVPVCVALKLPVISSADFIVTLPNFNTEKGLALSSILCSYSDHEGNLWFGTDGGGVSRYDGKSFTNFTMGHGLSGNSVYCITEDRKNNIWFGTNGGGVSCYNGKSFTNFTTGNGLGSDVVRCFYEDSIGNLWFGTNKGVYIYNGISFSDFQPSSPLSYSIVKSIYCDKNKTLWFATLGNGLISYANKSFTTFDNEKLSEKENIHCIAEDRTGNIWLGTDAGAKMFDGKYFTTFTTRDGLTNDVINCIHKDKTGNLWLGTDSGVSIFNGIKFMRVESDIPSLTMKVYSITEDRSGSLWFSTYGAGIFLYSYSGCNSVKGLADNFVNGITEDKAGNLWYATDNGVSKFDGQSFFSFSESEGLSGSNILSIAADSSGQIWMGTSNNGACKFDGKTFTTCNTLQGLANKRVWVINADKMGSVWFGTDSGATKFDGKYFTTYTTRQGLINDKVRSITRDVFGNIWFGTGSGGVSCFNGTSFINFTDKQGLVNNIIYAITCDSKGNLWICTGGGGISILTKEKLKQLSNVNELRKIYNSDKSFFETFTTSEGLANDVVYDLVENKNGDIIIGTNQGFTFIKGGYHSNAEMFNKDSIEYFNQQTNYPINDVNVNAMFAGANGIIWAGTTDKAIRFDYSSIPKDTLPPIVRLQNIKVNNENISWFDLENFNSGDNKKANSTPANITDEGIIFGHTLTDTKRDSMRSEYSTISFDSISNHYHLPLGLILPCNNNNITFEYVAIETAKPFLIRYQYMLEGYDKNWIRTTNKTSVNYGNLFEGNYTFKLKAQSPQGIWSMPVSYTFKILPPWYRTWSAFALYILLVIISLWAYIKWREGNLQNEKEMLENKVEERTHELNIEKNKSENLLLNILPEQIANELKITGNSEPKEFKEVTVLFTDFKNFTGISEQLNAKQLVEMIDFYYKAFDNIASQYGIEKIKTIGDSYMCAGGLPVANKNNAEETVRAAIEIREFMLNEKQKREATGKPFFEIRIGCHTGSVVAGIVGSKKFAYDIWGDTVNIASRMESSGEAGKINISGTTYELVKDKFTCTFRGKIEAKNKGMIDMYFVEKII